MEQKINNNNNCQAATVNYKCTQKQIRKYQTNNKNTLIFWKAGALEQISQKTNKYT